MEIRPLLRQTSTAQCTSLQFSHPLQQCIQGVLSLLLVSGSFIVEQGLLIFKLRHFAQQLPLQLPKPPLEHLSKVTGQPRVGCIGAELKLSIGKGGARGRKIFRPMEQKL